MNILFQEFAEKTFQDVEIGLAPQEFFHGPVKADEFSCRHFLYFVFIFDYMSRIERAFISSCVNFLLLCNCSRSNYKKTVLT